MAAAVIGICCLAMSTCLILSITSLPTQEFAFPSSGNRRYYGYQVLQVHFSSQADAIKGLHELSTSYQLDVWRRSFNGTVDVMVAPQDLDHVIEFVTDRGASYDVKITNVQSLLEKSMNDLHEGHRSRRAAEMTPESVTRRYFRFGQIRQYLRNVRATATAADVTVATLGRTFERRITPYVMIRQKGSRDVNRRAVVIEAGIHAREWIAPAMALSIVYKLAFNPDRDPDVEELLRKFDWFIIPVTNPDGYVFSQRDIMSRLWRKTRTSMYAQGVSRCFGVDGNRNFGYQWTDSEDKGGSPNPCHDTYSGPQGFSEPETRNMRSLLLRLRSRIGLFISLHSFGQFFLYPWGYDSTAVLEDEADMREIAQQFAHIMLQRDRWYEIGTSAQTLYAAAGASDDFAKGGAGVKYAFTIELSPSESSQYAFLLPARLIPTVVEDHWPAFKAIALTIWNRLNQTDHTPSDTTITIPPTSIATDNNRTPPAEDVASSGENRRRNGNKNGSNGRLTEVTIDGHTYQLDLSDPAVVQWLEYYMQLLHYRSYHPK